MEVIVRLTGIMSKWYGSRYLVVCLFDSVYLIPLKDIMAVFVRNVLSSALAAYVLR